MGFSLVTIWSDALFEECLIFMIDGFFTFTVKMARYCIWHSRKLFLNALFIVIAYDAKVYEVRKFFCLPYWYDSTPYIGPSGSRGSVFSLTDHSCFSFAGDRPPYVIVLATFSTPTFGSCCDFGILFFSSRDGGAY